MTIAPEQPPPPAIAAPSADVAGAAPPSPRRIVYVDHTASMGGGEIALLNLVTELNRGLYHPIVVLFADGPLAKALTSAGVETHLFPLDPKVATARKDGLGVGTLTKLRSVFSALWFTLRLARFIRGLKPALVHTNSLKADLLGGIAGRLARVPVLWHIRDRISDDYLPAPVAAAFRLLAHIIPNFVIANSAATLETLRLTKSHFGSVLYSGIDVRARAQVVHDGTDARNPPAPRAPRPNPRIGLVGRISPWKGQHIFIRAAAQVRTRFPDARFQIIGAPLFAEQAYEAEIRQLVKDLGVEDVVEFLGFRNDVPAVVAQLDILVHASTLGEPFGQVVIEGMAAAKPVVATNGGGVPEIVVDGLTGLLVPMGDVDAMASAVCRLLENPAVARRMGERGRQRAMEHFSIQRTATQAQQLYDAVLSGPGGRSLGAAPLGRRKAYAIALGTSLLAAAVSVLFFLPHELWGCAYLSLLGSVMLATWAGGLRPGGVALAISVVTVAYILPPGNSLRVVLSSQPRLLFFSTMSLLAMALIHHLRHANAVVQNIYLKAEAARRKSEVLTSAAAALSTLMDEEAVLKHTCYVLVGHLCDWALVDSLTPAGGIRRTAGTHRIASKSVDALLAFAPDLRSDHPVARVFRSGVSDIIPSPMTVARRVATSPAHLAAIQDLGCDSSMLVPIVLRGRVAAVVSLVRCDGRPPFNAQDLALATDITALTALALERAAALHAHLLPDAHPFPQ